jgi:hypothetical protein
MADKTQKELDSSSLALRADHRYPPDPQVNEVAAALLSLLQRVNHQVNESPILQGKALEARNNFAFIADALKVR